MSAVADPTVCLLRLPQILERTGLSRSEIYRRIAAGTFPQPAKLGSMSAWSSIEVAEWVKARLDEREAMEVDR